MKLTTWLWVTVQSVAVGAVVWFIYIAVATNANGDPSPRRRQTPQSWETLLLYYSAAASGIVPASATVEAVAPNRARHVTGAKAAPRDSLR